MCVKRLLNKISLKIFSLDVHIIGHGVLALIGLSRSRHVFGSFKEFDGIHFLFLLSNGSLIEVVRLIVVLLGLPTFASVLEEHIVV